MAAQSLSISSLFSCDVLGLCAVCRHIARMKASSRCWYGTSYFSTLLRKLHVGPDVDNGDTDIMEYFAAAYWFSAVLDSALPTDRCIVTHSVLLYQPLLLFLAHLDTLCQFPRNMHVHT